MVWITTDSITFTESTTLGTFVQQLTTVVLNADLSMRRSDQTGTVQGQRSETHLTYAGDRVKGTAVAPQPSGTPKSTTFDTTVVAGTIDDNARNVSAVTKRYVEDAVNALLNGKQITITKTKAIGCGIKWKDA